MTITNPPDPATRLRDWASEQLQRPLDGSWSAVRAGFLERVAAAEFCPSPALDYAGRVLADGGNTSPTSLGWQQAQRDIEKQLRDDVEQLAADWFSLAGRVRERRLQELRAACRPYANLLARLDALAPALDLDAAELTGPAEQLARMIGELFVLPPRRRAERRREMLLELEAETDFWDTAAQEVKARHPRWAALQPVFVESILARKLHEARARVATKAYAKSLKRQKATASEGVQWPWFIAALVILSLVRSSSCLREPPPPRIDPWNPMIQPRNQEPWEKRVPGNDAVQKLLSRKWRFEDGKLVPADGPDLQPQVKPALPPVIDPK